MRQPDSYPLLRTALVYLRWEGFLSAREIAGLLERWSVDAVRAQLQLLEAEGLLWSIAEGGHLMTHKFAHVRSDTGEMIVRARPQGGVRRSWRPMQRSAA
ncbi:hypothetical protein XI06_15305 [Bradyrhizobium sp. CCBAU 11434]|uniref:hypothetical protein n=1 Tax=Bradyrhizobium sp. CCBAU 11434 TaxID=1630885 RepID=UPI002306B38B|nr:hypothetical protein [Bradyrhizobium sp. CCBAU 11434]MDA9521671.1 hypothetical protein [Bradyrhizobium sp. CCBAU 11434]